MTKTEQVYGGSLYELASEEGLSGTLLDELTQIIAVFDEQPDYWQFLSTLSITKDERCGALDEALRGRIHPYLLNFLKLLCENSTIGSLKGCAKVYRQRYNADHDIVEVCAVTAVPMRTALMQSLKEKLEQLLNNTVELTCKVDPTCMGGVRLELPGRQLDGTVRHRLDTLAAALQQTP